MSLLKLKLDTCAGRDQIPSQLPCVLFPLLVFLVPGAKKLVGKLVSMQIPTLLGNDLGKGQRTASCQPFLTPPQPSPPRPTAQGLSLIFLASSVLQGLTAPPTHTPWGTEARMTFVTKIGNSSLPG